MYNKNMQILFILVNLFFFLIVAVAEATIPLENLAQKNEDVIEIEGELEVLHIDDFENPENSKYIHYLISGNKRYELQSDNELPIVLSGTLANVKGKISNNTILVKSFELKIQGEKSPPKETRFPLEDLVSNQETSQATEEKPKPFNLYWIYTVFPFLIIFSFLAYHEFERKRGHKEIMQQKQQQSMLALRNYVITNLRRGFTKEQIKNALIKNNYTKEDIEEAFRGLR